LPDEARSSVLCRCGSREEFLPAEKGGYYKGSLAIQKKSRPSPDNRVAPFA